MSNTKGFNTVFVYGRGEEPFLDPLTLRKTSWGPHTWEEKKNLKKTPTLTDVAPNWNNSLPWCASPMMWGGSGRTEVEGLRPDLLFWGSRVTGFWGPPRHWSGAKNKGITGQDRPASECNRDWGAGSAREVRYRSKLGIEWVAKGEGSGAGWGRGVQGRRVQDLGMRDWEGALTCLEAAGKASRKCVHVLLFPPLREGEWKGSSSMHSLGASPVLQGARRLERQRWLPAARGAREGLSSSYKQDTSGSQATGYHPLH